MSMTTPRVTVPVERAEYERLICATEDLIREVSDPGTEALAAVYCARRILDQSAMLSAAPAPEGGAVSERLAEIATWTDEDWETVFAHRPDLRDRMRAALATREEAPAEAGVEVTADSLRSVSDETMRALLSCKDVASGRAHLAAIINALRAQPPARPTASDIAKFADANMTLEAKRKTDAEGMYPPAREDAEPFGYWVEHRSGENPALIRYGSFVPASDHYKITTLYTHPAPDALRGAVEALEATKALAMKYAPLSVSPKIIKALAALQAEQKGGV